MNKALVIIDIQNDYFKEGKCELVGADNASLNAQALLNEFRTKKLPIIHIQHVNIRKGATFFVPNTLGVEIHNSVAPNSNETVIIKHYPNSFLETNLEEVLETLHVKELIICGMMSHMCVDSTVRAAFDKGYVCEVAHDACATKDLTFNDKVVSANEVHHAFMAGLNYLFAKVKSTHELLS